MRGFRSWAVATTAFVGVASAAVLAPQVPSHAAAGPDVDVASVSVQEGDSGLMTVQVPITLSSPTLTKLTVNYAVTAGTATSSDFTAAAGKLVFPANVVEKMVNVKLKSDTDTDGDRTVRVGVTAAPGANVRTGTGTVTVVDDDADGQAATPELAVGSPVMREGDSKVRNALVPVTLSSPATAPVTVDFATDCNLGNGARVSALKKKVTFPIGSRIKMVPVKVTPDGNGSDGDQMTLHVARRTGAASNGDTSGDITVVDDDAQTSTTAPPPPPIGIMRVSEAPGGKDPKFPKGVMDPACGLGTPSSQDASVTENGRYVVFASNADNLVPHDTNGAFDVFIRDTSTDVVDRLSVAADGTEGNDRSYDPSITPDGRFVTFKSHASNLVPGDTNQWPDMFVVDLAAQTIELVGPAGQSHVGADSASISDNGRYVVFDSNAVLNGDTDVADPDPTDANVPSTADVYLLDRTTDAITLISKRANGSASWGYVPVISGDGNTIFYMSGDAGIVPGDPGLSLAIPGNLWAKSRLTGATEKITVNTAGQQLAWSTSTSGFVLQGAPTVSTDGTKVAFLARTCNAGLACVQYHGAAQSQAYVRDRVAHTTTFESIDDSGAAMQGITGSQSLSANGRYLLFGQGRNLPTCSNGTFVLRDLQTHTQQRVDIAPGGGCPNGHVSNLGARAVTSDGRYVVFASWADDLLGFGPSGKPIDGDRAMDIFLNRLF